MPPTHKVEEEPDYRQTERSERNVARGLYWKRRSGSTTAWTCVSHRRPTQNRHVQVLYSSQSLTRWLHSVLYKSRGFFECFQAQSSRPAAPHSIKPLFSFCCPAAVFHLSDFPLHCHPRNHWMWQPACRRPWIIKQNRDPSGAAHLQSAFAIHIFAMVGVFCLFLFFSYWAVCVIN